MCFFCYFTLYSPVPNQYAHSNQHWVRLKSGVQHSTQASSVGDKDPGLITWCFPGCEIWTQGMPQALNSGDIWWRHPLRCHNDCTKHLPLGESLPHKHPNCWRKKKSKILKTREEYIDCINASWIVRSWRRVRLTTVISKRSLRASCMPDTFKNYFTYINWLNPHQQWGIMSLQIKAETESSLIRRSRSPI